MRAVKRRFCMGSVSVLCLFFRQRCAPEDGKEGRFYKPEGSTASTEMAGRIERGVRKRGGTGRDRTQRDGSGRGGAWRGGRGGAERGGSLTAAIATCVAPTKTSAAVDHLRHPNPSATPPPHDARPPTAPRIPSRPGSLHGLGSPVGATQVAIAAVGVRTCPYSRAPPSASTRPRNPTKRPTWCSRSAKDSWSPVSVISSTGVSPRMA